jgi:hypothetical protein
MNSALTDEDEWITFALALYAPPDGDTPHDVAIHALQIEMTWGGPNVPRGTVPSPVALFPVYLEIKRREESARQVELR